MKANELMIGDLVRYNGEIARVTILSEKVSEAKVVVENSNVKIDDILEDDAGNLQPIPLTAEILYKNFPDARHGIAWCYDDTKSTDNETWYELRTFDIDGIELCVSILYVHELQHVLRLCGIEKEVVL